MTLWTVFAVQTSGAESVVDKGSQYYSNLTMPVDRIAFYSDQHGSIMNFDSYNFPNLATYDKVGSTITPSKTDFEETIERERNSISLNSTVTKLDNDYFLVVDNSTSGVITIAQSSWNSFGDWYVATEDMHKNGEKAKVKEFFYYISPNNDHQVGAKDNGSDTLLTVTTTDGNGGIVISTGVSNPTSIIEYKYLYVENPISKESNTDLQKYFDYCEYRGRLKGVAKKVLELAYIIDGEQETQDVQIDVKQGLTWTLGDKSVSANSEFIYKDYNLNVNEKFFTYSKSSSGEWVTTMLMNLWAHDQVIKYDNIVNNRSTVKFPYADDLQHRLTATYAIRLKVLNTEILDNGATKTEFKEIVIKETTTFGVNNAIPLFPNITTRADVQPYFNNQQQYAYVTEYQMSIYYIVPTNNVEYNPESIDILFELIYDMTPPNIDSWILGELGSYNFYYGEPVEIPADSFLSWLSKAVGGFFSIPIFGAISLGAILWFCIGLGALFGVLKYFAGG